VVEVELIIKKWGRSFGAIIPMNVIKQLNLKEFGSIKVDITTCKSPVEETFGTLKFTKPISKILQESDSELWNE